MTLKANNLIQRHAFLSRCWFQKKSFMVGRSLSRCGIFGRSDNVGKIGVDNDEEFVEFRNDQFFKLKLEFVNVKLKM